MASLPPRYGDDTWYAVIGYEGDPHILAYRRDHPDHITVPLRWKNPPPRQDTPDRPPPRPPAPSRRVSRADPVRLPRPDEMLTVAELKAIMAEARAASAPGRGPDDLLIPVQGNRGPRGPRPVGPPGARRDWTAQELWNQHRIDIARTRLAELEPRNPMLQSLEPAGTPPTPRMADAMEAELIAARGRGSRGEPGREGPTRLDDMFSDAGGQHSRRTSPDEGSSRPLENAERARIDSGKLDYFLNPAHPRGGDKARVFAALGFNRENASDLLGQIRAGLLVNEAVPQGRDVHGTRFRVDIPIVGPTGSTAVVRTGWIYDTGSSHPRLVTAFVR